ncbi:MAG: 4Fe-4S binding protein [Candidatus Loosdrechtia sp.]|uniref:4Fe-4S binding protein n=1 Tax=Candidatus Loosdrechtia sp. TaxID=3101272 RepID=UPI003A6C3BE1|nr:MAG: 4Fe-4S binding protein [Candidatus Jettenia sp. AMX2]
MEWDKSASFLLEKVPPFVQKVVREKVETLARSRGKAVVTEAEVIAAREEFMGKASVQTAKRPIDNEKFTVLRKYSKYFDKEGNPFLYQVKSCNGAGVNCPFLITDAGILTDKIKKRMEELNFTQRLMDKIKGPILPHHTMKLAVSGCPNSCSMPQIKDFGVQAIEPVYVDARSECIGCMQCVEVCREGAVTVNGNQVSIDSEKCVHCGLCARACPSGSIKSAGKKYRVMIGGKVGRHPKFALDLLSQADESSTLKALDVCTDTILSDKTEHRFRAVIEQIGIEEIKKRI